MNRDFIIRPTTAEDIAAIGVVAEATGLFPASLLPEMIAGYFEDPSSAVWLTATHEASVVGFVFCEPERLTNRTWNMRAIGVSPERQGMGVGSMLTAAAETALRGHEGRVLIVETTNADDQVAARAFYCAKGYQEEARIRAFWDIGIDKVVFWKAL